MPPAERLYVRCERRGRQQTEIGHHSTFDIRAGCDSDTNGRGPCYMDLGFNNLVLGHLLDFAFAVLDGSRRGCGVGKAGGGGWRLARSGPWGPSPMTNDPFRR